ncbi:MULTISPECIES: ABC transporter ATP-binding protein [Salinicola]|uniref:ABC-type dipeptide transporter n=1 Tax=Salinicola socius TaxID=404433 RepID=A0A1Q8SVR2_9GAMM|nr:MULTISPECIES: ABC transporter ATP-binding protein [Salinicola]OLO05503.1 methionine ABC transporter ATP-binding protein [Salinicola socius]
MALLEVEHLEVCFPSRDGEIRAVRDVSFTLERGERLGIVGESGAGKSVLAFSLLKLLSRPGRIVRGQVRFEGRELTPLSDRQLRRIRGNRVAMIFQDPLTTLNPVLTIGQQMIESLKAHRRIAARDARILALHKLRQLQVSSPEQRLEQYPHQLSGGLCQRVVIAIALLLDPDIIIADEPTTALDVTIQAEIIALLRQLCDKHNVGLIVISHDLGVIGQLTQRLLVMYAGRIVEQGPTREIINDAQHPYTQGLINALPQMTLPRQRLAQIPGNMPTLSRAPDGCAFHPRCRYGFTSSGQPRQDCRERVPGIIVSGDSQVACHWVQELIATAPVEEDMP